MSKWTDVVAKVYREKHAKNPNYQFKDALKDPDAKKMYAASKGKSMKGGARKPKSKRGRASRKMRGGSAYVAYNPSSLTSSAAPV